MTHLSRTTLRFFSPTFFAGLFFFLGALLLTSSADAANVRIKDLTTVEGVRDNALVGYGLVVGLAGTGDSGSAGFTKQSVVSLLARHGVRVDPREVRVRNVAAVMVTGELSAFVRPGARMDVNVSAIGNARSLSGGTLLMTTLNAADGRAYALAQGPVQVGGFDLEAAGTRQSKNSPASGRVPQGATVERTVTVDLKTGPIRLLLKDPDFTTTSRLVDVLNKVLGEGAATANDPAAVELVIPEKYKDNPVSLLATLEGLEVDADQRAKVVISERTGTIVVGADVRLRPVVVAHGGFSVRVDNNPFVSQPNALAQGQTIAGQAASVNAEEQAGKPVVVPATTTVEDLAKVLTTLGATPRDLISILQAMAAAGALDAELEVL